MSGEFRWVSSSYFYDTLQQAVSSDDAPAHAVSKVLTSIYASLAPIERGCAWFEAGDSGSYYPTLELLRNIKTAREAFAELNKLANEAEQLVEAAIREKAA